MVETDGETVSEGIIGLNIVLITSIGAIGYLPIANDKKNIITGSSINNVHSNILLSSIFPPFSNFYHKIIYSLY
jgi:hypothetical protein